MDLMALSISVVVAVKEFFITGTIPNNLNSNLMVLIPKSDLAPLLDKFHPIELGNFIFKDITKIIAQRLNSITDRIISPNQFGFICGRCIHDYIALALEAVNCLNDSFCRRHMAIQIDIIKAFDMKD